MELDYSDETVVFSKVKTSQKNKTYEMGTDAGYTLVLKNQYISYGLDDTMFETYLTKISEYYTVFELTPMSFTLAEPDFDLHVGDRIQVYDEEEQVAITGNVSKIAISGNCSMTVTCGGFENVSSSSGFKPTSYSQIQQSKQEAKGDGTAEKLQTTGSKYWAVTDDSGVSFGADDSGKIAFLTKQGTGTGFRLGAYGNTGIEFEGSGHGAIKLYDNCGGTCSLVVDNCAEYPIFICTSDDSGQIDHTSLQVYNGGKLKVYPDSLAIQTESRTTLTLKITSDGWSLGMTGKKLEAKSDGLYFNGKKVLLEG